MLRIAVVRLLQTLPTVLGVSLVAFVVVRFMGDPVNIMLPPEADEEARQVFRERHGLDKPLVAQFGYFLWNLVQGDFGESIRYRVPVLELLLERFPATLALAGAAILLAIVVGWPLGIMAALRRGSWADSLSRTFALGGQAIPAFYLGILLIYIFGIWLHVLPTGGRQGFEHLILPSVTLAIGLIPLVLRVTRSSMIGVIDSDYVRTATAKGLPRGTTIRRHMLRNSLIPVVTIIGLQIGSALSGAVVTESVFSWPGVGRLLIDAISTRDYPVVQAIVVLASLIFVIVNLLVDLIHVRIDPRMAKR